MIISLSFSPLPRGGHLFYIVRNAQQVGADYGQTTLPWRSAASMGDPDSRKREGLLFEATGHIKKAPPATAAQTESASSLIMFQANQLGCRRDPGEGFAWETTKMSSFAQRLPVGSIYVRLFSKLQWIYCSWARGGRASGCERMTHS